MKDFFEKPPDHDLQLGDLVTCSCHGGVAMIIELFDKSHIDSGTLEMNMARIWWIQYPHEGVLERDWMHTIKRLRKYEYKTGCIINEE